MPAQNSDFDADADLQRLVSALDERVPREGSWIQFSQYGGGPDEGKIVGNRHGYQRLGIEFLKATLEEDRAESVGVDLEYLVTSDSTIGFDWFELSDSPKDVSTAPTWPNWLIGLGCSGLFLFAVTAFLIGVGTMIEWFTVQSTDARERRFVALSIYDARG